MSEAHPITRLNAALEDRYRIESELGEGGMATVYLADDLKHERKVALKVLKPELAAVVGAERFLAEIKTTANLQHPNILPLHDSGEADGFLYYVMPYIEGETLRDRLDRNKQLPVDEAVRIATDVGEALQAAHEQGVIHRDIKPANVLMSRGRPLVADFGIALAVSAAGGGRLTETGLSMGTPYYMSPEQASADREPSPASDVYSLGCVLYEMLVGEPPHTGNSAQSVLAKILTERPRAVIEMRATVPVNVAAAVTRSLERLPADRFADAEGFIRSLADPGFTYQVEAAAPSVVANPIAANESRTSLIRRWLPWGIAATALLVAGWSMRPTPPPQEPPALRMALSDFVIYSTAGGGRRLAISRDGRSIVATGEDERLHVRRSDDPQFRPIAGTEGARDPTFSPDGEWVAFRQAGMLNKVQVNGGPVLPILVEAAGVPHWHVQDEIVFSADGRVLRVSSAGGAPTVVLDQDAGRPFMLPGGRGLLGEGPEGLMLHDLESGESRLIGPGGSHGRYVPTGHVLYGDRVVQSVLALPFDLEALEATGTPVPVLPSVSVFGGGAVQLDISDNGTLVYVVSNATNLGGTEQLTWIGMDGARTHLSLVARTGQVEAPRVSPDGRRLAYGDDDVDEVLIYDLVTGERTQVTEGLDGLMPAWSSDGSVLFVSAQTGGWYRANPDGSTPIQQIATDPGGWIVAVSPDDRWGIVEEFGPGNPNLFIVRLDGESVEPQPYLRADWHEEEGIVSPDGNWLAYLSNEGGDHRVYLRSFPEPGPAVQVSGPGADSPTWAPDGSALYYARADTMRRRDVRLGETAALGEERPLFSMRGIRGSTEMRMYDIHPDGDRFVFVTVEEDGEVAEEVIEGMGRTVVVVNWFTELRQRMGGIE